LHEQLSKGCLRLGGRSNLFRNSRNHRHIFLSGADEEGVFVMIVQVCIGSSCHIKGSYEIVHLMRKYIKDCSLEHQVTLAGSFCVGKCNREGVTVQVDDTVNIGVTREGFKEFFEENILKAINDN
jgi:NADH:ubiquinone oxidoreductase subunit E